MLEEDSFCPDCSLPVEREQSFCSFCGHSLQKHFFQIGKKVGNGLYFIEKVIGQGGMGIVYKGWHVWTKQPVAIKTMDPHLVSQPLLKARFLKEARLLGSLHHPNVLSLINFFEEKGSLYLVTPLGKTDIQHFFKEQALSFEHAVYFFKQILSGIHYLHSLRILHRDIKPANCLLFPRGIVCVSDFGIATPFGSESFTLPGEKIGTSAYMAPESIQLNLFSFQSDIYSLGVLMFELLASQAPFEGNESEVLMHHIHTEFPDIRDFRSDVPEAFSRLLSKTCHKDPAERYESVASLYQELHFFSDPFQEAPSFSTFSLGEEAEPLLSPLFSSPSLQLFVSEEKD